MKTDTKTDLSPEKSVLKSKRPKSKAKLMIKSMNLRLEKAIVGKLNLIQRRLI